MLFHPEAEAAVSNIYTRGYILIVSVNHLILSGLGRWPFQKEDW